MALLQKSIDKREALLSATLSLFNNGGIQEASMAKVAKLAKVSPATIYLYFENKQDLIHQLYLKVKFMFSQKAFQGFNVDAPVKKSFETIWFNIAEFKLNQPQEASLLSQCDNTPIIEDAVRQEGLIYLQPLLNLWDRGKAEGIIKDVSPYLLYAFTVYPMAFLMNAQNSAHYKLDNAFLHHAFKAAWDSIKV